MVAALAKANVGIGKIIESFRSDAWENNVTGFGTGRDKTTFTDFGPDFQLAPQQLSTIYHGDDLASRMVDIVPDEMLREGFTVDVGDPAQNSALADAFESLGARTKFANAIRWGRLYGGGALLIGADDGRPASAPLVAERSKSVRYLYELDRRFIQPLTRYTDVGHPKLGQPETYWISPTTFWSSSSTLQVVHESRLILFGGATTGVLEKEVNLGWDHSVLQRVFEALRGFNTGWKAVEILLTDGNQAVFKMAGLREAIAGDQSGLLSERLKVVDLFRSVMRAITIDAGDPDTGKGAEDFIRHNVQFAGIPDILDRFMLRLAAAVQIPATILYGQSPAGMNSTGDADFRWFYNRIKAQQTLNLAPQIRRLARVMLQTKQLQSAKGTDAIVVTFPNLWTEAPGVEAKRRADLATADAAYVTAGVLTPEEVALARFGTATFGENIVLTKEGVEVRTKLLETGLEDELDPPDPVPPPAGGGFGGPDPAAKPDAFQARMDASDDLVGTLSAHERTIIAGGPRTGKSTTAARAGERYGRSVRSTDSLIGSKSWSDASQEVSTWFDQDGPWLVEGVAAPRALRKWLAANPGKKLDATIVWFRDPVSPQTAGQKRMTVECGKVWKQILPELRARGVAIIERD